jgi:hypothetical protein
MRYSWRRPYGPSGVAGHDAALPSSMNIRGSTNVPTTTSDILTLAAREADIVGLSGKIFRRGGAAPDISGWRVSEVDKRMRLIRDGAGDR